MYRNYYNLISLPFEINPDPKFLWLGKKHGEALSAMQYGITANKGFICLTGDAGTGKTTIVNALANNLGDDILYAKANDPALAAVDFFNLIANAFEMNKTFSSKGEFLGHLEKFLYNVYTNGKKVLLIIEEAQRLNQRLLEEIRLLSNIEKPDKKLINILFVGQNEFHDLLKINKALRHRITVSCRIEPLSEIETEKYILHRLKIAGSQSRIFSPDAVHEIFCFSGGNPRLINIICDLALLSAYVHEKKTIKAEIVKESTGNVVLPNRKNAANIKDPKGPANTIQQTRIKGPETPKDSDSEGSRKVRPKTARRKAVSVYMAAIFLIVLTGIAGYFFYLNGYKFNGYKTSISANQITELNSRNDYLVSGIEELKGNQKHLAEIKTGLQQRNQVVSRLEKKLKDLENALNQKKDSDTRLKAELSSKTTRVTDLQQQLKAFQANYNQLENEVAKSKNEIVQLQGQLSDLKAKQTTAATSPVVLKMHKKPPVKDDSETKSPHPAAIIDWVIKKKSE
jgi:type II secretory pathway predicted ATPase ExeA